jgi:hypothetical protein
MSHSRINVTPGDTTRAGMPALLHAGKVGRQSDAPERYWSTISSTLDNTFRLQTPKAQKYVNHTDITKQVLLLTRQAANGVGIVRLIVLHRINLGNERHRLLALATLRNFWLLHPIRRAAQLAPDA